jgi:hypothetical protein
MTAYRFHSRSSSDLLAVFLSSMLAFAATACGDDDGDDDDDDDDDVVDASGDDDDIDGSPEADAPVDDSDAAPPDGGDTASLPQGGVIDLHLQDTFRYGSGNFYSSVTLDGKEQLLGPAPGARTVDECGPFFAPPPPDGGAPEPEPVFVDLDVGPAFGASGGGEDFIYEKVLDEKAGTFFYDLPFVEGKEPWAGGLISFTLPGIEGKVPAAEYPDLLDVPVVEYVHAPGVITPADEIEITWNTIGGTEATLGVIDIAGENFIPICSCDFVEDGSATVPLENCLENATGELVIMVIDVPLRRDVDFNGRGLTINAFAGHQINVPRMVPGAADAGPAPTIAREIPRVQVRWPRAGSRLRPEMIDVPGYRRVTPVAR